MKRIYKLSILMLSCISIPLLSACGTEQVKEQQSITAATTVIDEIMAVEEKTDTVKSDSTAAEVEENSSEGAVAATEIQDKEAEVSDFPVDTFISEINNNDTGKTVIKAISQNRDYPNNSYMIISKSGTVLVADPSDVVTGIMPDIITTTHQHADHKDPILDENSDCKKAYNMIETFTVKDINVTSIASAHMGDEIYEYPSNVIYIYEVDGLRIAYMGDIGQTHLTDEQMKALGKIDIAFMQFVNSYSAYDSENGKGINLIEQLKPQIIIPTHSTADATAKVAETVGEYECVDNVLAISKEDLSEGKRKVIEIKNRLV